MSHQRNCDRCNENCHKTYYPLSAVYETPSDKGSVYGNKKVIEEMDLCKNCMIEIKKLLDTIPPKSV